MLVESVDGKHALLGRPRSLKKRGPVLTCLSGFIEQGESIEEAVRAQSYVLCMEGSLFGSKLLPIAQRLESICLRIVNTAINSMSYAVCVLIFSGTPQLDDLDDVMFIRLQL